MSERRKQLKYNAYAFAFLFVISLYRQISLRYLPNDPFRTYILYAGYVILIAVWIGAICSRVTQKSMRRLLLLESGIMLFGLTVRFLQDTVWFEDIGLMRLSGLFIAATVNPMILIGLYASLGTGQADDYEIPRKFYLLLLPVIAAVLLIVNDERYHIIFYTVKDEIQPNLEFHPYIGTFLLVGLGFAMMIMRVMIIFRRNNMIHNQKMQRIIIPFFEPLMIILFSFPYFLVSLQVFPALAGKEVIEQFAKIYYIEVLTWEYYIYMGLVPVNTNYREIFEKATIGMQLIRENGRIVSENALLVPMETLDEFKDRDYITVERGKELHIHALSDAYLLWNKDVSLMQSTISELNSSAEALTQEGELLKEELKTKNEEARLQAKNKIYDELTGEVAGQLQIMKELTGKCELEKNGEEYLYRLYLLGTFVKRRCNLRLIQKETGSIDADDLRLSFADMIRALTMMGIRADLRWNSMNQFSPEFSMYSFDTLENILEYERFTVDGVTIAVEQDSIQYDIRKSPAEKSGSLYKINSKRYPASLQITAEGYCLRISEGGDAYAQEI